MRMANTPDTEIRVWWQRLCLVEQARIAVCCVETYTNPSARHVEVAGHVIVAEAFYECIPLRRAERIAVNRNCFEAFAAQRAQKIFSWCHVDSSDGDRIWKES